MNLPRTGNLIYGTKGKMLVEGDYWERVRLLPLERQREFGEPEKLLERSPGHHKEFFMACRGEKPREFSRSNFAYAGPMTANITARQPLRPRGQEARTGRVGKITSDPQINELAWREPRDGWGPLEMKV